MTENATKLISPVVFQSLAQSSVYTSMFKPMSSEKIEHIDLAGWSDLFLLAPATANTIGKITSGIGDNLLTTTILALPEETPLVVAPAMNDNMWKNIFVQENIKKMEKRKNCYIIEPIKGSLASGKIGEGKMEGPKEIFEFIKKLLSK
jgi:phosphopantothenoylcysteine decarboxylase/phosphopantothenate--cysteine ligase